MTLENMAVVQDIRLYREASVSKDTGKSKCAELEGKGLIKPTRTPSGRVWLTPVDAETLYTALSE